MNKYLYTLVIFFLFLTVDLNGSNPISVEASRYHMSVRNTFGYSLKVYAKKGSNIYLQPRLLAPGESFYLNKNFTKSKLRRIKFYCRYDDEAFSKDTRANNERHENSMRQLNANKIAADNSAKEDFFLKLGYHAASNVETNTDDNWVISGLKWLIRNIGRAGKVYFSIKENFKEYQNKKYNNYEELFLDLAKKGIEGKIIEELSEEFDKSIGLKEGTSEYVVNAILYYIQQMEEFEEKYRNIESRLNQEHENSQAYITKLKSDFGFDHEYIAYDIAIKPLDMKSVTPNFTVTIDPFINGGRLNNFYGRMQDGLFQNKDGDDELEWSDGLWNKYLGGSFGFVVSPEMRLGKKGSYSKIYANIGYHQIGYKLDSAEYRLSNNFFSSIPPNSTGFTLSEPMRFEQTNLSGGLTWRFFIKRHMIIDLCGGYIRQNGVLNMSYSELSQGYSWKNEKIKIVDEKIVPFGGLRLGYGFNKFHNGTHFSLGVNLYEVNHTNITDYSIKDKTDNPIEFKSNGLHYKVYIGLTKSF